MVIGRDRSELISLDDKTERVKLKPMNLNNNEVLDLKILHEYHRFHQK